MAASIHRVSVLNIRHPQSLTVTRPYQTQFIDEIGAEEEVPFTGLAECRCQLEVAERSASNPDLGGGTRVQGLQPGGGKAACK